jgi:glyoxylase-like metal-dependent hydrolase (beta-lactamase superfamily II)
MITRRAFIAAAAAAGAAGLAAPRLWAGARVDLGGARLDAVSDGHLVLPADFLYGDAPQDEIGPILQAHGLSASGEVKRDCNLTLLRDGERTVLFDAGSGAGFMPTAGRLFEGLDALGVDPSEVTHVIFTHGHPDHLWGVLDDFGDLAFPEAAHLFPRPEWNRWMAPGALEAAPEARKAFVAGARNRLPEIEDRTELFDPGKEILPGILAVASHGHTAGHTSFEVRSGGESLMIVGDAIANAHVAFRRPDLAYGVDEDPDRAAATRAALLDRLAGEGMPMLGFHFPFPGIGRAERAEGAYRFVPADG